MAVFWNLTCTLIHRYQHFSGIFRSHHQDSRLRQVSVKCWYINTTIHDVTHHKTAIFIGVWQTETSHVLSSTNITNNENIITWKCVIPVVRVKTENWKRVCSQTQLRQLRCFNDYTRQLHVSALLAIFRLSSRDYIYCACTWWRDLYIWALLHNK